jgi:hypothetical protein
MSNQDDIRILKILASEIDEYFKVTHLNRETRSTDIFDFIKRRPALKDKFSSGISFSQFLRYTHKKGLFKKFITNCTVDDSNPQLIQWKFYRKSIRILKEVKAETNVSKFNYRKADKIIPTNTDQLVRSLQEQYIFNRLLTEKYFKVDYEKQFKYLDEISVPDFTIVNRKTMLVYFWEHFGMIGDEEYDRKLPDRIDWYDYAGIKQFELGGHFISTVYTSDTEFQNAVERIIEKIKNSNK